MSEVVGCADWPTGSMCTTGAEVIGRSHRLKLRGESETANFCPAVVATLRHVSVVDLSTLLARLLPYPHVVDTIVCYVADVEELNAKRFVALLASYVFQKVLAAIRRCKQPEVNHALIHALRLRYHKWNREEESYSFQAALLTHLGGTYTFGGPFGYLQPLTITSTFPQTACSSGSLISLVYWSIITYMRRMGIPIRPFALTCHTALHVAIVWRKYVLVDKLLEGEPPVDGKDFIEYRWRRTLPCVPWRLHRNSLAGKFVRYF